jgi:competence protein ComGF
MHWWIPTTDIKQRVYKQPLITIVQVINNVMDVYLVNFFISCQGRRGRDRMVVEFTSTYAISAYHHWCCEFKSQSGRGVQHYVIKFVSDLRQIGGLLRFHPKKLKQPAPYDHLHADTPCPV